MAVKYSVVARKNPLKPNEAPKYYAQVQSSGDVDFKEMTRAVADRCTVTASDAKAVLDAFQTIMIQRLQSGQIVRLNDLGSFRISLSSTGNASEEKFNAAQITKARIIFTPSQDLKSMCKALSYAKTSTLESTEKPSTGGNSEEPIPDPTV